MRSPKFIKLRYNGEILIQSAKSELVTSQQVDSRFNSFHCTPGDKYVIWGRVSTFSQKLNGNLDDQIELIISQIEMSYGEILEIYSSVSRGCEIHNLVEVYDFARKYNAKVVGEDPTRFIRGESGFGLPTKRQLREFDKIAFGIITEVISFDSLTQHRKRGQKSKANKGGRPKSAAGSKKLRRLELKPKAIELRQNGKSLGEIAKLLGVPRPTVQSWLKTGV